MNVHISPAPTAQQPLPTTSQQKRALTKLLRDLVAFTGTAITEVAAKSRKAPQPCQRQRLLYRHADKLGDGDLDRLVAEIGPARLMAALDRWTQPPLPFAEAAE
jgi:hypothetical protein